MNPKNASKFALSKQPNDYQISVHLNNLVAFYGKEMVDSCFKHNGPGEYLLIVNLCNLRVHYGIANVRQVWDIICPKKSKAA
jgi:hypothetical protein